MPPENMPTVSVIMPTYNYGRFIERAIRSVQLQTYQDFEIVVVDDGSTDGTEEIVRRIDDKRIRYIKHPKNKGGNVARNTGIRAADGNYIAFLDSDDEWLPKKLALQIQMFSQSAKNVGMIYTGLNVIDVSGKKPSHIELPKASGQIFHLLLRGNYITGGGSSAVFKKECFETVGLFDETLPSGQEWEMILRIAKKYEINYVNEPLVKYYVHGSNTDSHPEKVIRGQELILSSHKNEYMQVPDLHALKYYELGIRCFNYGFMKRGRKHFLSVFHYAPQGFHFLKLKAIIQILISFMGKIFYSKLKRFLFT